MIIKFFTDFADSRKCKLYLEKTLNTHTLDFYGIDKKIYITDGEDYTHAIIINVTMPILKTIPKENVIGLAWEPDYFLGMNNNFIKYAQQFISKYYIGDKNSLPDPFIEGPLYIWHCTIPNEITFKPNVMSIILSDKKITSGHIYRHLLVKEIIKNKLPIDIYGRGCYMYAGDNIKGNFVEKEPYEDYLFTIAIENCQSNYYFSEKITNAILYNCMPIYLGCRNIKKYVEKIIQLTGAIENDIFILKEILNEPFKFYEKTYTEKNLNSLNILKNIDSLFNKD